MPPKRAKPDAVAAVAAADGEADAKRPKVVDAVAAVVAAVVAAPPPRVATPPVDPPPAAAAAADGDARPMCRYGANCMRKNPDHFREFRHPSVVAEIADEHKRMKEEMRKRREEAEAAAAAAAAAAKKPAKKAAPAKKKAAVAPPPPPVAPAPAPAPAPKPAPAAPAPAALARRGSLADVVKGGAVSEKKLRDLELYRELLKLYLLKPKISVEEKRLMREFRRSHEIAEEEHSMLIAQLGWSEDEYEDGERRSDDDVDLDEERKVLQRDDGFEVIWIRKADLPRLSKAHENVFSRVCTKFFQTMAKAQANYTISEVGVIVNTKLKARYDAKKALLNAKGLAQEEWGFHGTGEDAIAAIARTGFLSPEEIAKINAAKGKGKGKKKPKKIEVLDDGFFGSGIYLSFYSDYAMWYSEERDSSQILLCKLLTGKSFKCQGRMDGKPCMDGYDSHFSPKGNEIVIFDPAGVLPRYIIKFEKQDEQEREQED